MTDIESLRSGGGWTVRQDAANEIEQLRRELRDIRAALVMIRGVVAGVLEDERPVGGEFA